MKKFWRLYIERNGILDPVFYSLEDAKAAAVIAVESRLTTVHILEAVEMAYPAARPVEFSKEYELHDDPGLKSLQQMNEWLEPPVLSTPE